MRRTTPGLLFQASCHTLTTTSWELMTRMWRTFIGPWMTTGTQSPSHQKLTEGDVPRLLLFADRDVIQRVRTQAASSAEPAAWRDVRGPRVFAQAEIKRHRQGLKVDELSSTCRRCGCHCLQPRQLSPPVDTETGRTEDAAPHHEPDIAHHDSC